MSPATGFENWSRCGDGVDGDRAAGGGRRRGKRRTVDVVGSTVAWDQVTEKSGIVLKVTRSRGVPGRET